jgi:hypothetical protein
MLLSWKLLFLTLEMLHYYHIKLFVVKKKSARCCVYGWGLIFTVSHAYALPNSTGICFGVLSLSQPFPIAMYFSDDVWRLIVPRCVGRPLPLRNQ